MLKTIHAGEQSETVTNNPVQRYPLKKTPNPVEIRCLAALSKATASDMMGLAWIFVGEDEIL